MSLWDEVEKTSIEHHLRKLENEDVHGLDEVIQGFVSLKETGIYENLKEAYLVTTSIDPPDNLPENSFFMLSKNNMSDPKMRFHFKIVFSDVDYMYWVLGLLYYTQTRNFTEKLFFNQIISSGLDKDLIFFQDDFDKPKDSTESSLEFFKKLQKVKWENNGVNKFLKNMDKLRYDIVYPNTEYFKFCMLYTLEYYFIRLMAACSAVRDSREYINKNDVIVGYKTYLKLLKTDITKYKARNNLKIESKKDDNGYMVCDKCNEYYKLQPDESPDDFSDKCECGGKLKYYDNVDWLLNEASTESQDGRTYS